MWPFLDCEPDGVCGPGKSSVPGGLPHPPPADEEYPTSLAVGGSSASTRSLIKKRETMDADRCVGGRGTGQKGRKVAGSPCTACKD